jgi:hypothetical protein
VVGAAAAAAAAREARMLVGDTGTAPPLWDPCDVVTRDPPTTVQRSAVLPVGDDRA